MPVLRFILGDQLSRSISCLEGCDQKNDLIALCEVMEEATYVKHHKKKIAFLFSAMRHFANELVSAGFRVKYVKIDDPENSGFLRNEIARIVKTESFSKVVVTFPGETRVLKNFQSWQEAFQLPVEIRPDTRFLCSIEEFTTWANNRPNLRMEYFYHFMRQKYGILMEGDKPIGGQWNFDASNRKPPKSNMNIPAPFEMKPDEISQEVIQTVNQLFSHHFGDVEPFYFAVTRKQALKALHHFIEERLAQFGSYQDAMLENEPWMYHSHLSFYINCGLLLPLECIQLAEKAFIDGKVDLNCAEGFIRQILGWREYVRGVYFLRMPKYKNLNFLNATRKLPLFYWSGETDMNCMKQCIQQTKEYAYAHHIQRLMVLGNFALLTGLHPDEVNEWYLIVYADAYEWVELPNVTGMILYADAGYLASKPYAAGGAYINKMSNYCKNCRYSVKEKNGPDACPFNYLYWDFLSRHRKQLANNQRIHMIFNTYDKMSDEKKQAIAEDAKRFLDTLD